MKEKLLPANSLNTSDSKKKIHSIHNIAIKENNFLFKPQGQKRKQTKYNELCKI